MSARFGPTPFKYSIGVSINVRGIISGKYQNKSTFIAKESKKKLPKWRVSN